MRKSSSQKSQKERTSETEDIESIGKVQDRMTQMPRKKVPWTTIVILLLALALFYMVITFMV
jgi:hypothetical protein